MKRGGFAGVTLAVFRKDTASELRTRYALNALFLFTVTTLSIILFSFQSATVPIRILSPTSALGSMPSSVSGIDIMMTTGRM